MNDLLHRAIEAHGGLDRFAQFREVSADISIGGGLWEMKRRPPRTNVHLTVDLRQERAVFAPFGGPDQFAVFTPQRLTVETSQRAVVLKRDNPGAVFAGDTRETPWDDLDQLYFGGRQGIRSPWSPP